MTILYIANIRLPTEKAHGVAVMQACAAFTRAGEKARLIVPHRMSHLTEKDPYTFYNVTERFDIVWLASIDLQWIQIIPLKVALAVQSMTFYVSLFFWLLFQPRTEIIYTRDVSISLFSYIGFFVTYECHMVSVRKKLFFFLCRRAKKIVAISSALKGIFVSHGFNERSILVAPSGVDLSIFAREVSKEEAREKLHLPQEAWIALYTGNFTTMGQDKGIADIIMALPHTPEVYFVAVGGSDTDRAKYERQAKEYGVSERVTLMGHAPQTTLALYQQAADVLLMPFPDTYHYRSHMSPVKMFEYMASKRPIIASDLPTIREVLDERGSVIVPPGSPKDIAQALLLLRQDKVLGERLAAVAYNQVRGYTWDARAKKIINFIHAQ